MATQCNQSQYPTLLKQICFCNSSASQVSQANLSNSFTSQHPPDPGENVLKKTATEIGEQDFPVKWFKFIYPSSKPKMTQTSTLTPFHVAYSPLPSSTTSRSSASMMDTPLSMFCYPRSTSHPLLMDTPLSMFCYPRSTSHPLFPPSVTSSLPCFTLMLIYSIPPQNLNMIFQV